VPGQVVSTFADGDEAPRRVQRERGETPDRAAEGVDVGERRPRPAARGRREAADTDERAGGGDQGRAGRHRSISTRRARAHNRQAPEARGFPLRRPDAIGAMWVGAEPERTYNAREVLP
jgi:hypothetical protein